MKLKIAHNEAHQEYLLILDEGQVGNSGVIVAELPYRHSPRARAEAFAQHIVACVNAHHSTVPVPTEGA